MAAEDQDSRTEPATARRRLEERNKGNVARSQDLSTAGVLLSALLLLYFFGGMILSGLERITATLLSSLTVEQLSVNLVRSSLATGAAQVMLFLAPMLAGLMIAALLINVAQVGLNLSAEPMELNLNKLNPVTGIKRIFSKRGLVRLIASFMKLMAISVVLYVTVLDYADQIFPIMHSSIREIFAFIASASFTVGLRMALLLIILAIIDFAYQRWQHEQEIKMTKQEVKDEMKRNEGDPKIKERRMRAQREIAKQRMMSKVPEADVVITNPTHLACAIRYDAETMAAPVLVAKGAGFLAHRIRELAAEHGVPIIEKKPLAQALYKTVEIGHPVPLDLYQAVAEILAYVYRLESMAAGRRTAEVSRG